MVRDANRLFLVQNSEHFLHIKNYIFWNVPLLGFMANISRIKKGITQNQFIFID